MHLSTRVAAALVAVALLSTGAGCGDKDDPVSSNTGGTTNPQDTVTYTADIASILDSRCVGCHSSALSGAARNGAPPSIDFDSFADAVTNATRANVRIQAGTMPPTGGIPSDERSLFQQWLDTGLEQ